MTTKAASPSRRDLLFLDLAVVHAKSGVTGPLARHAAIVGLDLASIELDSAGLLQIGRWPNSQLLDLVAAFVGNLGRTVVAALQIDASFLLY